MKEHRKTILTLGTLFLLSLPAAGQQVSQERDTSGSTGSSVATSAPTISAPHSIPQVSGSNSSSYNYASISSSRDLQMAPLSTGGGGVPIGYGSDRFINPRTSFWSYDGYYRSMQLFDFLMLHYGSAFGNHYFRRFYVNNEPILNTKVTQYAMQIPMYNAKKLLAIADQLQRIRSQYTSGQGISNLQQDAEFKSLLQEAKGLARLIHKYPALEYLEVRKSTNLTGKIGQKDFESCLNQMDSYIRMLQNQFQEILNAESPSMVSVQQLSQPSFLSLAKGIEKLANQLEKTKI